jgi:hypothetical protein
MFYCTNCRQNTERHICRRCGQDCRYNKELPVGRIDNYFDTLQVTDQYGQYFDPGRTPPPPGTPRLEYYTPGHGGKGCHYPRMW